MKLEKESNQKEFTNLYNVSRVHNVLSEKYGQPYHDYREQWRQAENLELETGYPLQLDFELNYSCNFTCAMCTWSQESSKNRGKKTWLSYEIFKEIIDDGANKGLRAIRLNYINEPLIRKDIYDFIQYAKKKGILDVYFSTNGSLLTSDVSKKIIDSGLDRIQISLDAFSSEVFNKIRQGGNLDKIKNNIEQFLEIRTKSGQDLPLIRVNFVKTAENEHEFEKFISYWSDKVDNIGVQNLVNIMNRTSKTSNAFPRFNCVQPFYHLTIRYDGTILPCCSFFGAEIPIARLKSKNSNKLSQSENLAFKEQERMNLPSQTIEEVWNGELMHEFRTMHAKGQYWKNKVCKQCVLSSSSLDDTK